MTCSKVEAQAKETKQQQNQQKARICDKDLKSQKNLLSGTHLYPRYHHSMSYCEVSEH